MLKRLFFRAAIPLILLILAIWLGDYLSTPSSQKLIGMPPSKALVTLVDKFQEVLFWLVIAAVISVFVVDHMFEEVLNPTLEKAVTSLRSSLENGLSGIREVMRLQMERTGHELTAVLKTRMYESTKKTIVESIKDPQARDAAKHGNYELAKSVLETAAKKDEATHEQWIQALVLTENREDWDRAWTELKGAGYLRPHLSLAFRYWSAGETDTAIDVARTGLTNTSRVKNGKDIELLLVKFKNSLAYYLADRADPRDEGEARRFAEEALQFLPEEAAVISTVGYVKITYGATEEVRGGMTLCEKARQNGSDETLFFRHVSRAQDRLRILKGAPT